MPPGLRWCEVIAFLTRFQPGSTIQESLLSLLSETLEDLSALVSTLEAPSAAQVSSFLDAAVPVVEVSEVAVK